MRPSCLVMMLVAIAALTIGPAGEIASGQVPAAFALARRRMVEAEIVGAGVQDPRVIEAMLKTPRHLFVLPRYRPLAYFDMALPIGDEQTISSPFIVAYMTESLDPQPTDAVLEIGTGSGYQAAVLSPLVREVFTIEIVPSLGRRAMRVLKQLKYSNVTVKIGDGFLGWPEHAPFDKIIVTCSPERVPKPLIEQLKEGGRMVIPTGERYQQTLYLFTKREGKLQKEALRPTLFVPMTGAAESKRKVQPDPLRPAIVNGDFEEATDQEDVIAGWYYGRQLRRLGDGTAPQGDHYLQFTNMENGRGSHLLQGLAVDGRQVSRLKMSSWFASSKVRTSSAGMLPSMIITFYDQERREVGKNWLGPWRGTNDWKQYEKVIRVPTSAREAIVRVGLFGATGTASFDDVQIAPPAKQ